jgi:hypothetical protein
MTVTFLRERAKHYLALAEAGLGPLTCDSYRELAVLLEREADTIRDKKAIGQFRSAYDVRPMRPEVPSNQRYHRKARWLRERLGR